MTSVRLRPGPAFGSVRAPPSKSYTHRALVAGHLSRRTFRVQRPLDSDDTRTTATALTALGTAVHRAPQTWTVAPPTSRSPGPRIRVNCRESGTTLRFVSALAALHDRSTFLEGSGRLAARPIDGLLKALTTLGARCRRVGAAGLPIEIRGPMRGGVVVVEASQSSQFASALLFALPTLASDSLVELAGNVVSEPYLEATLAVLDHQGIQVRRRGRRYRIRGGQIFRKKVFTVPGDASSAAYLWAAAAVSGGTVRVNGIPEGWPQADLAVLDLLEHSGSAVDRRRTGAAVRAGKRRPFRVDLTSSPDLYPLAGVLAATIPGTSWIGGAKHVALKESDRKVATAELARCLGARVDIREEGLRIQGTARPRALDLPHLADHRVLMSAAVGALAADGVSVLGERGAVGKSFPGFWEALDQISDGVEEP